MLICAEWATCPLLRPDSSRLQLAKPQIWSSKPVSVHTWVENSKDSFYFYFFLVFENFMVGNRTIPVTKRCLCMQKRTWLGQKRHIASSVLLSLPSPYRVNAFPSFGFAPRWWQQMVAVFVFGKSSSSLRVWLNAPLFCLTLRRNLRVTGEPVGGVEGGGIPRGAEGFTAPHHHVVTYADQQLHRCEQHLCAHVSTRVISSEISHLSSRRCGRKSILIRFIPNLASIKWWLVFVFEL